MVSSAESIGRLITEEVLLQSERQLLRNRDQSGQEPQEQTTQPPPAPLSHNDKAVASVLLTLLDEQLDAAAASLKESAENFAPAQASAAEVAPAATRIVGQYAEAESAFRPDLPAQQAPFQTDIANQQAMLAASPELRMAMQTAFLSAAVRAKEEIGAASGSDGRARKSLREPNGISPVRTGAAIFVAIVLAIVFFALFSR